MNIKVKYILSMLLSIAIALPLYIILHELGHAIVALLNGAENVRISIIHARMTADVMEYTPFMQALLNSAGMLFPLVVFSITLLFFNRKSKSIPHICIFSVLSAITVSPLFAWVIVPIVGIVSELPANDDVANFIINTGFNSIIVLVFASILIALSVLLIVKKDIPKSFISVLKQINSKEK